MSILPQRNNQIAHMTEGEFLQLSRRFQHKRATQLLRRFHEKREVCDLNLYRKIERWTQLPALEETDFQAFSDRYHFHLNGAGLSWQEHNLLLPSMHQTDKPSDTPYLPVTIYLDNLRSAFNVGSIIRTTEAFRLGTLCFAKQTPFIDNPKVQKTSMYSFDKVPCIKAETALKLPRPFIALETFPEAPSVLDFSFPDSFTLLLGNEEYGISKEMLSQSSHIVRIPLHGFKNSLNVASAYAIAAAAISHQLSNRPLA